MDNFAVVEFCGDSSTAFVPKSWIEQSEIGVRRNHVSVLPSCCY